MKNIISLLCLVGLVATSYARGYIDRNSINSIVPGDCPPGQYYPGPNCGLEVICAPPSITYAHYPHCDCWCNPGTYRDVETDTCVDKC